MSILYGHPESGHTYKVALTQAGEWLSWEANRIGLSPPNLRHCLRFGESPGPRWLPPPDLLREPPH